MARILGRSSNAAIIESRERLAGLIDRHTPSAGENSTVLTTLVLFRGTGTGVYYPDVHAPRLDVLAQGCIRVILGSISYACGGSAFLVSAPNTTMQTQIIEASERKPLFSMLLRLDLPLVREILASEEVPIKELQARGVSLAPGEASIGILEACSRLIDLLHTPEYAPFLSRAIERELVCRILCSPQGRQLRAFAMAGDLRGRAASARRWIDRNFHKPLDERELARRVGMGVSALRKEFRELVWMTPLEYHKRPRVTARSWMLPKDLEVEPEASVTRKPSPEVPFNPLK